MYGLNFLINFSNFNETFLRLWKSFLYLHWFNRKNSQFWGNLIKLLFIINKITYENESVKLVNEIESIIQKFEDINGLADITFKISESIKVIFLFYINIQVFILIIFKKLLRQITKDISVLMNSLTRASYF